MARPSDYTPEIAATICEHLSDGKSLRQIERMDGMPHRNTVLRWLDKHEEFQGQYARAREAGLDAMGEEIQEIADNGTGDVWIDEDGVEHVNSDVINRSRLRVDARKWIMSKLAPKKYGDKIDHAHSGAITVNVREFKFDD